MAHQKGMPLLSPWRHSVTSTGSVTSIPEAEEEGRDVTISSGFSGMMVGHA